MAILNKFLNRSEPVLPCSATRVDTKMSDEEKELELQRLREEGNQFRSKEEEAHYQRKLQSMRSRGIPLRLVSKTYWEKRQARKQQRHLVA